MKIETEDRILALSLDEPLTEKDSLEARSLIADGMFEQGGEPRLDLSINWSQN